MGKALYVLRLLVQLPYIFQLLLADNPLKVNPVAGASIRTTSSPFTEQLWLQDSERLASKGSSPLEEKLGDHLLNILPVSGLLDGAGNLCTFISVNKLNMV